MKQKMRLAAVFAGIIILVTAIYLFLDYERSVFRINFLSRPASSTTDSLDSNVTSSREDTVQSTTTKFPVPAGFQGPSGAPKIIGPSGPPPNY